MPWLSAPRSQRCYCRTSSRTRAQAHCRPGCSVRAGWRRRLGPRSLHRCPCRRRRVSLCGRCVCNSRPLVQHIGLKWWPPSAQSSQRCAIGTTIMRMHDQRPPAALAPLLLLRPAAAPRMCSAMLPRRFRHLPTLLGAFLTGPRQHSNWPMICALRQVPQGTSQPLGASSHQKSGHLRASLEGVRRQRLQPQTRRHGSWTSSPWRQRA
mmetsp:Transcript_502/g.1586  ORF Transcript_502/g.1586 Transcript_502/m.1586 type:complete len:208 (+) Transcript_502:1085-1708(+)